MKQRLARSGQRSISALVDVTNYVMLELGRPLHVYDLDKLARRHRRALRAQGRAPEAAERADGRGGRERCCASPMARARSGSPASWAATRPRPKPTAANIFLESAFFFPEAIAGRTRRYNFTSDAAHRFERGVDFDNNVAGIERATELILAICGGEPGPTVDDVARLPERKPVHVRSARAAQGARHRRQRRGNRRDLRAPRASPATAQRGRLRRDAAFVSLRHRDRGRPDRGDRAHSRLRAHSGQPPRARAAMSPQRETRAPAACG